MADQLATHADGSLRHRPQSGRSVTLVGVAHPLGAPYDAGVGR